MNKSFNIRVYGWLTHPDLGVLTTIENIKGKWYRKFPGGGLEWGEGINDCLQREFMEELNFPIQVKRQLYTTHFFQLSAFNPNDQVLSIYLEAIPKAGLSSLVPSTIQSNDPSNLRIEWIAMHNLEAEMFPLPIDQVFIDRMKNTLI